MEKYLREKETEHATACADALPVAVDGYLREQGLFQLQCRDVIIGQDNDRVVLLLGRSRRGESSKTGRDQGVGLEDQYARKIINRRVAHLRPHQKVFDIKASHFRALWKEVADAVTGDQKLVGPPHSLRHTGASRDIASGRRSIEDIMIRGRWKVLASVSRYAKVHAWVEAYERQSERIKKEGGAILRLRSSSTTCAR